MNINFMNPKHKRFQTRRRNSQTLYLLLLIGALGFAGSILNGCGRSAYDEESASLPGGSTNFPGGGGTIGNGGGNYEGPDICAGNSMINPSTSTLVPAIPENFTISGAENTNENLNKFITDQFTTDDKLCVRIKSGPADTVSVPGYSYSASYSCVKYRLKFQKMNGNTVLDEHEIMTKMLAVEGQSCVDPEDGSVHTGQMSQVFDMSEFAKHQGPNPPPIRIVVEDPHYDHYCQIYWDISHNPYSYPDLWGCGAWDWWGNCIHPIPPNPNYNPGPSCPTKKVYKNHTVQGTLFIQLNGNLPPDAY